VSTTKAILVLYMTILLFYMMTFSLLLETFNKLFCNNVCHPDSIIFVLDTVTITNHISGKVPGKPLLPKLDLPEASLLL